MRGYQSVMLIHAEGVDGGMLRPTAVEMRRCQSQEEDKKILRGRRRAMADQMYG